MENIEINAKLIIIVILISIVIGILLWAGYNIYIEVTEDEDEGIENFETDVTSNINNNIQSDINNSTEFNISDIIGNFGFEINNSNAAAPKQGWLQRKCIFREAGCQTMYYVPNDWKNVTLKDEKNGVTIEVDSLKIKNIPQETSYEDFLNMFIEAKEKNTSLPKEKDDFSIRTTYINGEKFYVIVEKGYNNWNEYFCLAKDEYAIYLKVVTPKEKYNQELINLLNEIFATFRIVK